MNFDYKIYGFVLEMNIPNDDVLSACFDKFVGLMVQATSNEKDGVFIFRKMRVKEIQDMDVERECEYTSDSYVDITGEYSSFGKKKDCDTFFFYYKGYYYIEFCFDKDEVKVLYSDMFYKISELLMEFMKQYCCYKAVENARYPIHSSCILDKRTNEVSLLMGDSGNGKSSLAVLASLSGKYDLLSDEINYINSDKTVLSYLDGIKLCVEMTDQLEAYNINVNANVVNGESIVRWKATRERCEDVSVGHRLKSLYVLRRENSVCRINVCLLYGIKKLEVLYKNFLLANCINKRHKIRVIKMIHYLSDQIDVTEILYPTNMIKDVIKYIGMD